MSKHDFTAEEFAHRRSRVREAIGKAGLDWLVLFHPVSIHWLTGSDAKSYQEFQCLLISAKPGPVSVLTRAGERNEFHEDALVDQIWTWGGGEPEFPIEDIVAAADISGTNWGADGTLRIGAYTSIATIVGPHDWPSARWASSGFGSRPRDSGTRTRSTGARRASGGRPTDINS